MNKIRLLPLLTALVLLIGCGSGQAEPDNTATDNAYIQIDQETAKEMMAKDDGHVVVDVRRQDEYDAGHIPGAILIPNESITTERPEELPDLNQVILIYCRSGNRSKQAAQKLADMGYTNIFEFGGINTWTGEIVTEEQNIPEPASPEPTPEITDESFADAIRPTASVVMEVNGYIFYPGLADNSSADAFFEKLTKGEVEVELHDYGNFEKVGPLPWELPRNDEEITTVPGDIILYQGNQITIYYDQNTWNFTRLGKIENVTKEKLLEAFGEGETVTVTFWLEWSE